MSQANGTNVLPGSEAGHSPADSDRKEMPGTARGGVGNGGPALLQLPLLWVLMAESCSGRDGAPLTLGSVCTQLCLAVLPLVCASPWHNLTGLPVGWWVAGFASF